MDKQVFVRVTLLDRTETIERQRALNALDMAQLMTKPKLVAFVFNDVFARGIVVDDEFVAQCVTQRKLKKHRAYVPLESHADFDELKRSLKVKSHVSLIVKSHVLGAPQEKEPQVQVKEKEATESVHEPNEKAETVVEEEYDDPPVADLGSDFGGNPSSQERAETAFQEPLDQLKDAIQEFQNSGIWFGLRNLAASAAASHLEHRNLRVQNLASTLNDNANAISHILNGTASTLATAINQNASLFAEALNKSCQVPEPQQAQPQAPQAPQAPQPHQPQQPQQHQNSQFVPPKCPYRSRHCVQIRTEAHPNPNPWIVPPNSSNSSAERLLMHRDIICDTCYPGVDGPCITGVRYKCLVCRNFDMCSKCFMAPENARHTNDHPMLAISNPNGTHAERYTKRFDWFDGQALEKLIRGYASHNTIKELTPELQTRGISNFLEFCATSIRKARATPKESPEDTVSTHTIIHECSNWGLRRRRSGVNFVFSTKEAEKNETEEKNEVEEKQEEKKQENVEEKVQMPELALPFSQPVEKSHPIDIFLYPTGPKLAVLRVTNKGTQKLDCQPLVVEMVDFLGKSLTCVSLNLMRGVRPNRTMTFNIAINNAYFKHPFTVYLRSAGASGFCELKKGVFVGRIDMKGKTPEPEPESVVVSEKEPEPEVLTEELKEEVKENIEEDVKEAASNKEESPEVANTFSTEGVLPQVEQSQESSSVSSSVTSPLSNTSRHSVVFPKLTASTRLDKSGDDSLYFETRSSISSLDHLSVEDKIEEDDPETEEYDLVSVSDADDDDVCDFGSDYEVLSPVVSHE